MGSTDRTLRTFLAIVIAVLYFTGTISGTWGMVLLVAAFVFVLTSLFSFCPLYALLGIKTCKTKQV